MKREARRHDPVVPKVQRVELSEGNLPLRLLGVGIAIAIAVAAFGYAVNSLLTPPEGWQKVEPTNGQTGIATQLNVMYDFGTGGSTALLKQVSTCYTETADYAYRVLSNVPAEHYVNLSNLNAAPNTPMTVDQVLYDAIQKVNTSGNRSIYYAPIMEQYYSLFSCGDDVDAVKYDPAYSEEAMTFVQAAAEYAADPASVEVLLLEGHQLELRVSEPYLQFAKEHEISSFVDFGRLQNAFIVDAIADALTERGLVRAMITSYDGFSRTLSEGNYSVSLYGMSDGAVLRRAVLTYTDPVSVVSYHSFPVLQQEESDYYIYADGTIRTPFVGRDGLQHPLRENLAVFDQKMGCAEIALKTLSLYAESEDAVPDGITWAGSQGTEVNVSGSGITAEELAPGFHLTVQ